MASLLFYCSWRAPVCTAATALAPPQRVGPARPRSNLALVVVACAITVYFGPCAAGSGIADVKIYLNGIDAPGTLLMRTLVAKAIGSVCSVAGGLAVGKEGPFVHIGACIASALAQARAAAGLGGCGRCCCYAAR